MRRHALLGFAAACTTPAVRSDISYDDRHDATRLDVYLADDGALAHPTVMFSLGLS